MQGAVFRPHGSTMRILARDIRKQLSHRRLHLTARRDENALTWNEGSETLDRTHQRCGTPT